ncbi:MAG: hypothetical protein AVDCRST_MAG77-660, partial [uncultured Chloroflexi bacterium]
APPRGRHQRRRRPAHLRQPPPRRRRPRPLRLPL